MTKIEKSLDSIKNEFSVFLTQKINISISLSLARKVVAYLKMIKIQKQRFKAVHPRLGLLSKN